MPRRPTMSLRVRSFGLVPFVCILVAGHTQAAAPPARRVDAHGDPLPPRALARFGTLRLHHPGATHLAVSPDGNRMLSVDDTEQHRELRLWDTATGKLLARRGVPDGGVRRPYALGSEGAVYLARGAAILYFKDLN